MPASAASAGSAACVFAANAVSVAGVAVPPAGFFREELAALLTVDVHCPVSSADSAGPGSALRQVDFAAAGISGPSSRSPCWEQQGARPVATTVDALPYWRVESQQPQASRGSWNTFAADYCVQHTHAVIVRLPAPNVSHEQQTLPGRRRAR